MRTANGLRGLQFSMIAGAAVLLPILVFPEFWRKTLSTGGFLPHSYCFAWDPAVIWLNAGSDVVIGVSYFAISATLAVLVHRARREIPFSWMLLAFGFFIVACGMTHLMEVWTLWAPRYWLAGDLKLITAVASVTTAVALPPLVPRVLALVRDAKMSRERERQVEIANDELSRLNTRLKELDELKTQFFANVSHELRTPLTLILAPAERLRTALGLTPDQVRAVDTIERNGRMLLTHINELLDISKLEAGKMELTPANADLAHVVRLVAANFESVAEERGIGFAIDAPAALPAKVDEEKLRRVLLNLLSNAFKFTPHNGRIRCVLQEQAGCAVLEVSDSGPGVPAAMREAIFERYRQLPGGRDQRAGGTGLGLAIVKEFVELHGGRITVVQSPIGGALFRAEIPLVTAVGIPLSLQPVTGLRPDAVAQGVLAEFHSAPHLAPSAHPAPASAELVLIVEDNADMRSFLEESLADLYRVVTAANGREGLAKALELKPDLILSDIMMPEMGGEALLQQLQRRADLATVPMIFLSAKADDEFAVRILREGAQDYLRKPFGVAELRVRAKNLIAMHRVREALQTELRTHDEDVSRLTGQLIANAQALQESEQRWRTVFENSPIGIGLTDVAGRVLAANPALERTLGYTRADLRNMSLTELMPEEDRAVIRSRVAGLLEGSLKEYHAEKRYCRSDGRFVWTNTSVSLIPGIAVAPAMLVRIVEDITERKRAEEALRTSEERFRRYFELGLIGMAITSPAKGCLEVNDELCRILGYERGELLQKTWVELTHRDDLDADVAQFNRVMAGEIDGYTLDKRWIRKDGQIIDTIMAAKCVRGPDGTVDYFLGLVQDTTERKRSEEAVRRMETELEHVARVTSMGEMVTSIAHEINQPLAAVVTNGHACTHWLAADPPDLPEANEAVRRIVRDANRASEVIARIRAFVKRGEPQRADLAVDDLIREVVGLVQGEAATRGVSLRVDSPGHLVSISADRIQLQQVLLNLVMNAMEAMATVDRVARVLDIDAKQSGVDNVLVSVRDAGIGLDPARRERIFDAFYTTKPSGMGMGLAISRSIVEAHGGRLWAVANDGAGETFQFTLLIAPPAAS